MIPIALTIEGLYSYQSRQTIDFTDLTDAGLFGIFGSVGSGKSSILEAISFALYGETERMNSKEKRAYNMMNLKSDKSIIEFIFSNYANNKYKIVRTFKRNSKRFDDVKATDTILYLFEHNQWIPQESSNIEPIIGLSYSNFKRTIIIPQGQFKEFLELGATERTKMMKEIFGLERFDLQDKVSAIYSKTKTDLDTLKGKLSGFEEISEEKINALKIDLESQSKIQIEHQNKFNQIHEAYQKLKNLKDEFEVLKNKKNDFELLKSQKEHIDNKEKELIQYESFYNSFSPLLNEQTKLNFNKKEIKEKLNKLDIDFNKTASEIETLSKNISELQKPFEDLPNQRKIELDLENIAQILKFTTDVKTLKDRTEKGEVFVKNANESRKKIEEKILILEKEIENFSKNKIDTSILLEIESWFSQLKAYQDAQQKQSNEIEKINKEILKIDEDFKLKNIDILQFENLYKTKQENLEKEEIEISNLQKELEIQKKLSEYSHSLIHGEACPLCGALEHPNIVKLQDTSEKLIENLTRLDANKNAQKALQIEFQTFRDSIKQRDFLTKELKEETQELTDGEKGLKHHLENFKWEQITAANKEDFEKKKNELNLLDKKITDKNTELKVFREQLQSQTREVEKFTKAVENLKIEEKQKEAQIEQLLRQIKILDFENYKNKIVSEIFTELENLKNKNNSIEKNYQDLNKKLQDQNLQFAGIKASLETLKEQNYQLDKALLEINKQIDDALISMKIESIDVVTSILAQKIDIPTIRKQIEDFKFKFVSLSDSIKELEEKFSKTEFNENLYKEQEEALNQITVILKEAVQNVTKTQTEITRLEKEFLTKKELLVSLEQLEKRSENLKIMTNLFKGAGFVQYVSSIYLRQLCDHANLRFHRMTKNQLSLQLNENNDFEIIDYLNEGKSRSVKTLSGGQAFQVSLSLALALAESVQSNAKAQKNFFFIDEGFGTQDIESINIVFETLQSLQKENRIVGIISHVEELKERIPISLQITKHEEQGSIIQIG